MYNIEHLDVIFTVICYKSLRLNPILTVS